MAVPLAKYYSLSPGSEKSFRLARFLLPVTTTPYLPPASFSMRNEIIVLEKGMAGPTVLGPGGYDPIKRERLRSR